MMLIDFREDKSMAFLLDIYFALSQINPDYPAATSPRSASNSRALW